MSQYALPQYQLVTAEGTAIATSVRNGEVVLHTYDVEVRRLLRLLLDRIEEIQEENK
jgi:hypothetical protein